MQYLALIYSNEQADAALSPEEQGAVFGAWMTYTEDLAATGKMRGGEPLQPTMTATTVRLKEGNTMITDGPYAETKEQLGGYYLIEADNLDEAIAAVIGMPHLPRGGAVEVRPLMEIPGRDGAS